MEGMNLPFNAEAVQATATDALVSKLHAIRLGYWQDPFAALFTRKKDKRPPLINRGYWTRYEAFRTILEKFLTALPDQQRQIISVGSGLDTSFFLLKSKYADDKQFSFYEVDFAEINAKKIMTIQKAEPLQNLIEDMEIQKGGIELSGKQYHIISEDLRDSGKVQEALERHGLDPKIPTLIIAECVLVYIDPESVDELLNWSSTYFQSSIFLNYDMINPHDAFGQMMLRNIEERGCNLLGLRRYPTVEDQRKRFETHGFSQAKTFTMLHIYNALLDNDEKQRIAKLEIFDEFEEWNMIQEHYAITIAHNVSENHSHLSDQVSY